MDWVKWLIPLVVIFVVIVSNLARIAQEEKKKSSRRPGPGNSPPRPQRPQNEAERFLEEINRRRREAGEQRKPPVVKRAAAGPARVARRETPSAGEAMAAVVPVTSRVPRPVRAVEMPMPLARQPSPRPVEPERRQPAPVVEEVVVATVVPVLTAPGDVSAGAPAAVIAVKPHTPTATLLRQLLRNPQSVKAAFVLREVLDRPLCRRSPRAGQRG